MGHKRREQYQVGDDNRGRVSKKKKQGKDERRNQRVSFRRSRVGRCLSTLWVDFQARSLLLNFWVMFYCCTLEDSSFTLHFADNYRWLLNDTPQGSYKRCFMPIPHRSSGQTVLIIIIMVMVSVFRNLPLAPMHIKKYSSKKHTPAK